MRASIPAASRSDRKAPMTSKVRKKMPSMMAKNSGRARYLLVTTRSMASLRARSRDSRHFTTVPEQMVSMKV